MPVHDWKAVDTNLFHHFHQRWTVEICDALNGGILPAGYSALVEQRAAGVEPDVLAFERRSRKTAATGRPPRSLDPRSLDPVQDPFLVRERSIERNGNPDARLSPSPR